MDQRISQLGQMQQPIVQDESPLGPSFYQTVSEAMLPKLVQLHYHFSNAAKSHGQEERRTEITTTF